MLACSVGQTFWSRLKISTTTGWIAGTDRIKFTDVSNPLTFPLVKLLNYWMDTYIHLFPPHDIIILRIRFMIYDKIPDKLIPSASAAAC